MTRTPSYFSASRFAATTSLSAQWPRYPAPGPKTPDGKLDLNGPTPRTPDGKPICRACGNHSGGTWRRAESRRRGHGRTAALSARFSGNVGDQTPGGAPYQPWAADLVKKRIADNSKDNPDAHCLPMGVMQMTSHPYPKKIIQTPLELVMIYEGSGTTVRELFLDGRVPDKGRRTVVEWLLDRPLGRRYARGGNHRIHG
jgi:hypothetical protein